MKFSKTLFFSMRGWIVSNYTNLCIL